MKYTSWTNNEMELMSRIEKLEIIQTRIIDILEKMIK